MTKQAELLPSQLITGRKLLECLALSHPLLLMPHFPTPSQMRWGFPIVLAGKRRYGEWREMSLVERAVRAIPRAHHNQDGLSLGFHYEHFSFINAAAPEPVRL